MFNDMFTIFVYPASWSKVFIVPIYKEGDSYELTTQAFIHYMYLSCVPGVDGKIHPEGVVQHRR